MRSCSPRLIEVRMMRPGSARAGGNDGTVCSYPLSAILPSHCRAGDAVNSAIEPEREAAIREAPLVRHRVHRTGDLAAEPPVWIASALLAVPRARHLLAD